MHKLEVSIICLEVILSRSPQRWQLTKLIHQNHFSCFLSARLRFPFYGHLTEYKDPFYGLAGA